MVRHKPPAPRFTGPTLPDPAFAFEHQLLDHLKSDKNHAQNTIKVTPPNGILDAPGSDAYAELSHRSNYLGFVYIK